MTTSLVPGLCLNLSKWNAGQVLYMKFLNTWFVTHWGMVMLHGDLDLGQHWLRLWFVAWQHLVITWIIVDSSLEVFYSIHLRAISQEVLMNLMRNTCMKITLLKLQSCLPGANELTLLVLTECRVLVRLCTGIGHHMGTIAGATILVPSHYCQVTETDWAPINAILGYPSFKWVAVTWLR